MILLIDIGNTSIVLGMCKNEKIYYLDRFDTQKNEGISYYKRKLAAYFRKHRINKLCVKTIVFCSVVPILSSSFKKSLNQLLNCKILEVGKDLNFYIKNKYKNPKQVGADRLINAIAAHDYYKQDNVIIVDFGTAITFDVINKRGEYLGGLILPGINTSLRALSREAELLPDIRLMKAQGLIGKDTATSMRNGIIYATASACDGIIIRLKKRFGQNTKTLATGGYANLIKRYTSSIQKVDKSLTLRGLYINYVKNLEKLKNL